MHPDAAAATLKATSLMRLPVVMVISPLLSASVYQLFFVLLGGLGVFALMPWCLLVHVVHVVAIDLAQAVDSMLVNELVVLVQGRLPLFLFGIIEGFRPFPCC